MTRQLAMWTGQFGNEYVDRNEYADWKLELGTEAFRRMLGGFTIESVLEVGSNIGLNLCFLHALFQGAVKLYAIEPNRKAFDRLLSSPPLSMRIEQAWNCDVFHIPLPDSSVDLVFTAGVLIHIAPEDLGRATDEIVRVSRTHILCMEYFSHTPVEVPYRGHRGLLFKRDFGAFYLDRFPTLQCVGYGFLWKREWRIFDDVHWWLFEKPSFRSRALGGH